MSTACINCDTELEAYRPAWLNRCPSCRLLQVAPADKPRHENALLGWDATSERFMRPLRERNTEVLLHTLAKIRPLGGLRLLDVGCAAGWFLDGARAAGMLVTGVEPDAEIATLAKNNGHDVRVGWFPGCLDAGTRFDVISFNDVFEHLAAPGDILDAVCTLLAPGGLLLLNLPNANGVFYRIAALAARLGDERLLERLWQTDYESPHIFYYNPRNLQSLAAQHGFRRVGAGTLSSIVVDGLWTRVNEGDRYGAIAGAAIYAGILLAYPLIRYILPADIFYQIYQLEDAS